MGSVFAIVGIIAIAGGIQYYSNFVAKENASSKHFTASRNDRQSTGVLELAHWHYTINQLKKNYSL